MNDLSFFSLHCSHHELEERLLRDTLDFAKLGTADGVLFSWRWHFFLGTFTVETTLEAQVAACEASRAAWVAQWEEAGRRLDQTMRGVPERRHRAVRFDESSSSGDDHDTAAAPTSSTAAPVPENPLVPSMESSYALLYQADALRQTVAKDMNRLFWDLPLFRAPSTKDAISDILLKYCLAEGTEYKQGFHELVAFLYYACCRDKSTVERLLRGNQALRSNPLFAAFEETYANVPAVVYALFRRLITTQDGGLGLSHWYYVENIREQSGVVVACERVQQDLLARVAPELQHRLDADYDIQSVVYLVRWLRLLFLRELPFPLVLQVWTVMFCERYVQISRGAPAYLLDDSVALYFAVQLLLNIRVSLAKDSSTALQLLMRYPALNRVEELLYRAVMSNVDSSLARLTTAPRIVSAADVITLPAEVTSRQGEILASVIRNLEQFWVSDESATVQERECMTETYVHSIALLKQMRDVLLYGVGE